MAEQYTPEDVLKLIKAAHDSANKLEFPSDRIMAMEGELPDRTSPASCKKAANNIAETAIAYGALAKPAAYFGHDPAPFTLGKRLGLSLARAMLVRRLRDKEVSPFWSQKFWEKYGGNMPHPTDAILKLEVDMRWRVAATGGDARDNGKATASYPASAKPKKKKRGPPSLSAGESRKRLNIVKKYTARGGLEGKAFCEKEGIAFVYLNKCLSWNRMRKIRSANKTTSRAK